MVFLFNKFGSVLHYIMLIIIPILNYLQILLFHLIRPRWAYIQIVMPLGQPLSGRIQIGHKSGLFIIYLNVNIKPPRHLFGLRLCLGLAIFTKHYYYYAGKKMSLDIHVYSSILGKILLSLKMILILILENACFA